MEFKVENSCSEKNVLHCINCSNHFMMVRSSIKSATISREFARGIRNDRERDLIVNMILDCSDLGFTELHKFEKNIGGNLIFRAKKENVHVVYCIDKKMRILFLRAFKNYSEYARFLDDKGAIRKIIARL